MTTKLAPTWIVTGFTPYQNRKMNQSSELIKLLSSNWKKTLESQKITLEFLTLPTVWDECARTLLARLEQLRKENIWVQGCLSIGEAPRKNPQFEIYANNLQHASKLPDNKGMFRVNQKFDHDLPIRIPMRYPLEYFFTAKERNAGVSLSFSPGTYICNQLSFLMTRSLQESDIAFGFLHIPISQSKASLHDLSTLVLNGFKRLSDNISTLPTFEAFPKSRAETAIALKKMSGNNPCAWLYREIMRRK